MGFVLCSISGQLNGKARVELTLLQSAYRVFANPRAVNSSCGARDKSSSKLDNAGAYTVAYSEWLTEDNR